MKVWMTYCHANHVAEGFMRSVVSVAHKVVGMHGYRGYPGDGLILARNAAMRDFLASDADYLWSVDTDIIFPSDALDSMLGLGEPVVSGLYRTVIESYGDSWTRPVPALKGQGGALRPVQPLAMPETFEADAVGAGFLLVHRDAAQAVRDAYGETWWTPKDGLGEDYSFCSRLTLQGYHILVDQRFTLRHQKEVWV